MAKQQFSNIPDKWLGIIIQYIMMFHNDTVEFNRPHMRMSMRYTYPLFFFLYGAIIFVGTIANICVIVNIIRRRVYNDPSYCLLGNIAISNVIKCVFVLPVTLANLMIQNWVFGSFLCFFLPMMQDIPIHATTISFLLIALDRYRVIMYPTKPRIPCFISVVGIWLVAVCVVLPYAIYMTYFDLHNIFGSPFEGTGICAVNIEDDIEEYMRGMFIALYVLPLVLIAYLYVKVSGEIKARENPFSVALFETPTASEGRSRSSFPSNTDTACAGNWSQTEVNLVDQDAPFTCWDERFATDLRHTSSRRGDYYADEDDFDPVKEKRTQKHLITMVTVFAMCMCPLNILRLVKHVVLETYENSSHFDITYTMFVWIGFLPTCTTPILYASWQMSRPAKDRLRGYFRLSNRRRHSTPGRMDGEAPETPSVISGSSHHFHHHCKHQQQHQNHHQCFHAASVSHGNFVGSPTASHHEASAEGAYGPGHASLTPQLLNSPRCNGTNTSPRTALAC